MFTPSMFTRPIQVQRPQLLAALLFGTLGCTGELSMSDAGTDAARVDSAVDAHGPDAAQDASATRDAHSEPFDAGPPDAFEPADAFAPRDVDEICRPWRTPVDDYDQSVVPVEVEPLYADDFKIVLVAGRISGHPSGQHEYFAGMALLAKMLCQTPHVVPVIVRDGWPTRDSIFDNADAIVFYADGGVGHPLTDPAHREVIRTHIDRGVGFANLHFAVEYTPEVAPIVRPWIGGTYETGYSINYNWPAHYTAFPSHPIASGVSEFTIDDEWYHTLRFIDPMTGMTPVLSAAPPDYTRTTPETMMHFGRVETTAWAYERPTGGRSFGFTGGHYNDNWFGNDSSPMQRRIVTNGLLWIAGAPVPPEGARVEWDHADDRHWKDRR